MLFDPTNLYKPLPGWQFVLRVRSCTISARKGKVAGKYLKRFSEIPGLKLTAGEGFFKDFSGQKTRVEDTAAYNEIFHMNCERFEELLTAIGTVIT